MNEKQQLSLKELRQLEFEMLVLLRDFCEEHQLRYFLSNGTLLGAVKYKGFIPWDDDIDIFLPRKDYDYFIEHFVDSEQYQLFSPERVKGYAFPFAKLCDRTTRREEPNNNNGAVLGVDVDIFPLDAWDENAQKHAKKQAKRMIWLRLAKNRTITARNPLKRVFKKAAARVCKQFGSTYFVNRLKEAARSSTQNPTYMGCVVWPVYGVREVVPASVFSETVQVEFEGERFSAPAGYDIYLRSLYGDYEQDPPLEKQKTHHRFVAYRL